LNLLTIMAAIEGVGAKQEQDVMTTSTWSGRVPDLERTSAVTSKRMRSVSERQSANVGR